MKIYEKKLKSSRESENFYFGDYGEIPIGISFAGVNKNNKEKINDKLHFHKESNEFYITIGGEGILEVEGKEIILNKNSVVMIEPQEKHKIIKATKIPFNFIVISTRKKGDDKIVIEN